MVRKGFILPSSQKYHGVFNYQWTLVQELENTLDKDSEKWSHFTALWKFPSKMPRHISVYKGGLRWDTDRQTDKYTDTDYCRRRGSPSVYSSIERVVKITLQRTRHDNSQRTHSSLPLNRLIALIEKKKYLGSEGDARGEKSCANWTELRASWSHHNAFGLLATASLSCYLIVAIGITVFQIEGIFNTTLYLELSDLRIKQLRETRSTF